MGSIAFLVAFTVAVGLWLGLHRKRAVRTAARIGLGLLFALFLLLTLALTVGGFALEAKGGGVMLLFALPAGFIAWLLGMAFFASVEREDYYALSVDEKIAKNLADLDQSIADLEAGIAHKEAELQRIFISPTRRRQLKQEIARDRALLIHLPQLRPALEQPRTYAEDEGPERQ